LNSFSTVYHVALIIRGGGRQRLRLMGAAGTRNLLNQNIGLLISELKI